jgi:hypothetical protein
MLDLGSLGHSGTGRTGGPVVGKCSSVVSPVGFLRTVLLV